MSEKDSNEAREDAENAVEPSRPSENEDTRENKVTPSGLDPSGEEGSRAGQSDHPQDENGWVNEADVYPDPDEGGQDPAEEETGDLEATAGWWGEIPFTPIESADDEETQPIRPLLSSDEETRVTPLKDQADPNAETRITATGTDTQQPSDDMPTIPPPNAPQGWTPTKPNLPKSVSEVDGQATRVTPSAYSASQRTTEKSTRAETSAARPEQQKGRRPSELTRPEKPMEKKRRQGCLVRVALVLGFLIVLAVLILGSIGIYQYFRIRSTLPDVSDLRERAAQFETTRILDRDGNVLYEILDPNAGRRTYVSLEDISPYLIAATLATEDKDYYTHPGFDMWAMMRALYQNYTAGEIESGASTITQQLARALLLDPSERYEQSYERKAREIVLAYEITRQYSKEEILELYLNENYYGNLAYGVQAASETYFRTSADALNLWQSSFLAGLPQAPAVYDIYNNRDATLYRQRTVLVLMYELSLERNCIEVGLGRPPVCVSYEEATQAGIDLEAYEFPDPTINMTYPHWVVYVRTLLEEQFDPQTIYRSGFTVHTTLDPDLQDTAERIVSQQVAALEGHNATNGALVAMDPNTGEILAMVGSEDFYNEAIDGQVNMALSKTRQPGSAIKPLTYVAAFEKGWTPSTLIWDVPSEFPPSGDPFDTNPPYIPVNYDGKFHGPVTVRSALANSYNIPAVKALEFVGINDDPDTPGREGLIAFAERLGITSLTRQDYGLSLTLGGGEVSLMELTGAFATFANEGRKMPMVAISKIVDHSGNLIYEYETPPGEQVVRVEHAYLISSILADKTARVPMFGTNPVINLDFTAAVKTGTTNDFRDNWTMGYTPDLAVGVWVGNADYTPMVNTTGLTGAGPIWAQFMTEAIQQLTGGTPSSFVRPPGILDRVICEVSGTEPSEWCPRQTSEIFAADQLPAPKSEDLWKKITIDTWTGLGASEACKEYTEEVFAVNVDDPWAQKWLKENSNGRAWAESMDFSDPISFVPERECRGADPRPVIGFVGIGDGDTISASPLEIRGSVYATENFESYRIEWGRGSDPVSWKVLVDNVKTQQKSPDVLYEWDLDDVEPGMITLKIYMESTEDTYAERTIVLNIQIPTATPTLTPTSTETMVPTITPTETMTPTPSPTNTPTPTQTPTSSLTPTSTVTVTPT